jgi:hypothetical protein
VSVSVNASEMLHLLEIDWMDWMDRMDRSTMRLNAIVIGDPEFRATMDDW